MNDLINMVHTLNGNLIILNNTVWSAQNNSNPEEFEKVRLIELHEVFYLNKNLRFLTEKKALLIQL